MSGSVKDFSSISPSAQTLLWMKAITDIPFAREAAALVFGEGDLPTNTDPRVTPHFLKRLLHFEARYWSIDAALGMTGGIANVLELSSGFSFRGLQKVLLQDVFYIDTDLPDVIQLKETLLKPLLRTAEERPLGQLLLKPLNVLDEDAFTAQIRRFPPGPLVIVNEGLLVYFDLEEKRRLCRLIRAALKERGGFWITADIYVRKQDEDYPSLPPVSIEISKFLSDHHVEENKFDSFAGAESFFRQCGLRLSHKAFADVERLKSMELLKERSQMDQQLPIVTRHRIRETWMLEVAYDD
jgi:O-methyltransferase involved in polyketide biosynthesis